MADEPLYNNNKRKYDDPPPRVSGFSDEPLYNNNKRKYDGPPPRRLSGFSDVPSCNNVPPYLDEIRIAKQKAQEIAARLLNTGDVKRRKFDDTYNDSRDYNEPQDHNMVHGKPLFDILSKLPSKSLLRFRCVSKLWRELIADSYFVSVHDKQVIEHPTPIMFSSKDACTADTLCFHTIESDTITNHVLKLKNKVPVFESVINESPYSYAAFVGSCNGLVLIENGGTDNLMPTYIVIHPIIKQCYVLPKLPYVNTEPACGLGFDSSTNTFKMVCVYPNPNNPSDKWTMVHVLGTNSWHRIPQVPSYDIDGDGIFAHGCLHWLVDYESVEDDHEDGAREVIWFDVKNEEFGLIKPPMIKSKPTKRKYNDSGSDHLVNLDGQVGYFVNKTTEVWVLNHKKEWMLHCGFEDNEFLHDGLIEVLGCLNKDGDILIKVKKFRIQKKWFYIYNLKNRVIHEARIDGFDLEDVWAMDIVMLPNSLCDIITNSNLFKKRA